MFKEKYGNTVLCFEKKLGGAEIQMNAPPRGWFRIPLTKEHAREFGEAIIEATHEVGVMEEQG